MHVIIIIIIFFINSNAMSVDIPSDFLYNKKIIDPNCILESNENYDINLKQCSNSKGKKIISYSLDKDSIGYNYINESNNYSGSITYKYLGKINNSHVIQAFAIGGSVSRLNYINYLQVDGDHLKLVKRGPAGDRSFGGIFNAEIKDNSLNYDMHLTAKLFSQNFSKNKEIINVFEDLPHCAICKFAQVHYLNNEIKYITLNKEINVFTDNKIEECFNKIHSNFIENKQLKISPKEAEEFVETFITKCIKN